MVFGKFDKVVTVEDGCIQGGMGSAVLGLPPTKATRPRGAPRCAGPLDRARHASELYTEYGYNVDDIAAAARKLVGARVGQKAG